jgi:hypothetical protein
MATPTLVNDLFVSGREVLTRLEETGITLDAALWLQDDDSDDWRLIIATEDVDRLGPRHVYERLASIVRAADTPDFGLGDIGVFGTTSRVIAELKRRVGTSGGFHDIRLDDIPLGGRLYRTARIYRVSGGSLERDARVKVKTNGRLGTVRAVVLTPHGPRYLVMYDLRPEDVRPLGTEPTSPAGQDFAADELEFLYVVRTDG